MSGFTCIFVKKLGFRVCCDTRQEAFRTLTSVKQVIEDAWVKINLVGQHLHLPNSPLVSTSNEDTLSMSSVNQMGTRSGDTFDSKLLINRLSHSL